MENSSDAVSTDTIIGDLEFACPRCEAVTAARFYGPCPACRDQLRVAIGGEARDVEVEAYVPKMNVTPNAVASRE